MRFVWIVTAALALAGCPELRALNDAMEQRMYAHPGGPAGAGLDMFLAGQQYRALKGR